MKRNRELAKKYSAAMYAIACEMNALEEVENQLVDIAATVRENDELKNFLSHPMLTKEAKKEVVKKIFADGMLPVVMQFLSVVIDRSRIDLLQEIVEGYVKLSREGRNLEEAKVVSAVPLEAAQEALLVERLKGITGKDILLTKSVDPSIIGGMIVTIGDRLIDGSVTRQLKEMKATLMKYDAKGLR